MAIVKPFVCVHPAADYFEQVAALPYDVYSRAEAKSAVEGKEWSFLKIDRPETQFADDQDMYADCVYEKAASMLNQWQEAGILEQEEEACYFIYSLTMNGREQTGIVGCSAVDDYLQEVVRKHEFTLAQKEQDRIRHVDTCSAQTGPIFLAYRSQDAIRKIVADVKNEAPLFDFTSEDGVRHAGWKIADTDRVKTLEQAFAQVPFTYIADGHHRCASAVKVALKRREEKPDYDGTEEFNYFLSILFPDEELKILPYNRLIRDLNGMNAEEFLKKTAVYFTIEEADCAVDPTEKGTYGLYLDQKWYVLKQKEEFVSEDCVDSLDVAYLQNYFLTPILGITDPKTDHRIAFCGGIRGIKELERRCAEDMRAAVSMYPTSIAELLEVADHGRMMPPKSTWFEPKLRSGLFIHKFEE